jgi:hypothetical protein
MAAVIGFLEKEKGSNLLLINYLSATDKNGQMDFRFYKSRLGCN